MKRNVLVTILVVCLFALVIGYWPGHAAQSIDFARDIQPILATHCVSCHGAKKAAGQLRLDSKTAALRGGLSGAVIVPGNSKGSLLLTRVRGEGGQAQMPMGSAPLTAQQIALLQQWIEQGAVWPGADESPIANLKSPIPTHWAYVKPTRPALPAVKNQAWVRNPIDAFVLARLEKDGLQPSSEANKETLLRRVYLDLIGLPPSIQELDEFLADKSPNAYEKVVDKLLTSPHYGERWARPWLDLARYADSNGYEKDRPRLMWKYRDWVINALNADMPFNQFTIEQLAGDMLPNATIDQKIASGFHRNTLLNQEGGVDDEEARFETMVDRVNTTATVWLGSTMNCSQCHNHKYDPFTQKDYYRLMAFFDNHEYKIIDLGNSEGWVVEPELELPTPEQAAKRQALRDEIAALEAKIKADTPTIAAAQTKWESEQVTEANQWLPLDPMEFQSSGGATLTKLEDKSLIVSGTNAERDDYRIVANTTARTITGLRIEALPDARLPRGGPGRDPYGNFVLSSVSVTANGKSVNIATARVDNNAMFFDVEKFLKPPQSMAVNDNPGGWSVDATRDQSARLPRQMVLEFAAPLTNAGTLTITLKHFAGGLAQGLGRVRLSVTSSPDPQQIARVPAALKPVLATAVAKRTPRQTEDVKKLFRDLTPLFKTERDRLTALKKELDNIKIVTALIMGEKQTYDRPSSYFHERGAYLNKGEKLYAATPVFLPPLPESAPINRLGLAYWLVDENNPLTARVTVNRCWEQFFGRGIVLTSEDFGTQGEAPSHPELLDWLAKEFIQQKWSMKNIHRLIVNSATYRQASTVPPALQEKDPYNRLLARGPRFRAEAEMVRDIGLRISGLLSNKIGGPSVFPSQPEGIWNNPYSTDKWLTSKGEDRYRRSLYTFIRRTSPHPAMSTFDQMTREVCSVRRPRTNTPLQSLTLLNDEAAMENARALAERMQREGSSELRAQLTYGFRLCTSRVPKATELARLVTLYEQQRALYQKNDKDAQKLTQAAAGLNQAEGAARIMVANVLLNLDETLTKE